jgi:hypothetical protein
MRTALLLTGIVLTAGIAMAPFVRAAEAVEPALAAKQEEALRLCEGTYADLRAECLAYVDRLEV